ncbi:MAG: hypothetical protein ACK53Y_05810, partial [bacterium]
QQNGIRGQEREAEVIELARIVQAGGGRHKKPQGAGLILVGSRLRPRGVLQKRDRAGLENDRVDLQMPEPAWVGSPGPEQQNQRRRAENQGEPKKVALPRNGFRWGGFFQ